MRVAAASLVAALVITTGCDRGAAPIAPPVTGVPVARVVPPDSFVFGDDGSAGFRSLNDGYVDDIRCAECHQALYESYKSVGMSKTFSHAGVAPIVEDFENYHYYHEPSDRHYEMTLRDGKYYQRRYQIDVEGNVINDLEVEVEGFIGSGGHVRTYVFRNGDYELYELPLAWYEHQHTWLMNPGYDKPVHSGFTRRIGRSCMFCHNSYPAAPLGSDEYWQPPLFPRELGDGHGCQRCHGPGEHHVQVARDPTSDPASLISSIVNPGRFDPAEREDICLTCHLLPSASFPSRILRDGRPEYSQRPGERLDEYSFHIDYQPPRDNYDRFEINHHAYRLFQSECHKQSNGQLGCLTCHDPHSKPAPEERIAYHRANCLKCHEVEQCDTASGIESVAAADAMAHGAASLANCMECHMPVTRTQDVIHVTMTDHTIVARPRPEAERLAPREEFVPYEPTSAPHPFWDKHVPPDANGQLHLAMAGAGAGLPEQIERLRQLIDEQQPDFLAPYASLAEALGKADRYPEAVEVLEKIVRMYPDHGRAHTEYGLALERVGEPAKAIAAYRRSLELGPPMPEAYLGLGTAHNYLGQFEEAVRFLEMAIEARPIYPIASLNLGIVHEHLGEFDKAEARLKQAMAADPLLALGYLHLGQVHWKRDQRKDALRVWRQGVKAFESDPRLAEARAMGMLYAAAFREALVEADRAFKLGADEATCLLLAALAQHNLGNRQVAGEAFAAARQAMQQVQPDTLVFSQLARDAQIVFLGAPAPGTGPAPGPGPAGR